MVNLDNLPDNLSCNICEPVDTFSEMVDRIHAPYSEDYSQLDENDPCEIIRYQDNWDEFNNEND